MLYIVCSPSFYFCLHSAISPCIMDTKLSLINQNMIVARLWFGAEHPSFNSFTDPISDVLCKIMVMCTVGFVRL